MATTLTAAMRLALEVTSTKDYGITGTAAASNLGLVDNINIASGTADRLFHASGTLADGVGVEYDLSSILDPHGQALNLTKLMIIVVRNTTAVATDAASLIISGGASNKWTAPFGDPTDTIIIAPATALYLVNTEGWTVDATHKTFAITHNGSGTAAATYQVAVVGKVT
jgi:hypothetical protein